MAEQQYAGFWIRTAAHLIDSILTMLILSPLLNAVFGASTVSLDAVLAGEVQLPIADMLIQLIPSAIAVIVFWRYKSATPGKMILKIKIIDIKTGGRMSLGQATVRFFAYLVPILPIGLGFISVGLDEKKQGWHDKLVGTAVVKY